MKDPYEHISMLTDEVKTRLESICLNPDDQAPEWLSVRAALFIAGLLKEVRELRTIVDSHIRDGYGKSPSIHHAMMED